MTTDHNEDRFRVTAREAPAAPPEESLVSDSRAGLTPAEMVDRKLVSLLPGAPLPISQQANRQRRAPSDVSR
jgi:hypothetical protein